MPDPDKTNDDAAKKAAEEAAAAKAAQKAPDSDGSAPLAAWQARDYDGPLDAAQAAWRNEHLQPWRDHSAKPAKVQATK